MANHFAIETAWYGKQIHWVPHELTVSEYLADPFVDDNNQKNLCSQASDKEEEEEEEGEVFAA